MNWPAQAFYNRREWLSLADAVALLPVRSAAARVPSGAALGSGFAAFVESLVLSALPDGNHGEIVAREQSR